jgi:hypothetical protein
MAGCSLPALKKASTLGGSCLHHCTDKPGCESPDNRHCLALDVGEVGANLEPRLTDGLIFELELDGTPSELVATKITCEPSGQAFVMPTTIEQGDADKVVFEVDSTLPDQNCCRVELRGGAIGWLDLQTLAGDVTLDGGVSTADASTVGQRIGQPATSSNFRYDVNIDGSISSADRSSVKQRLGSIAADCP